MLLFHINRISKAGIRFQVNKHGIFKFSEKRLRDVEELIDYSTFEDVKQQFYILLSFSDCKTIAYIDKTVRKVKELTYCHHSSIANYWKDRGKLKGFNGFLISKIRNLSVTYYTFLPYLH